MLTRIGLQAVQWKSDPFWNFVAMNITNIWLGIPFMIVILLGGLQSLSPSYFEAADMDGASGVRKLRTITLPLIQPIMTPAIVLGIIWTFNNFNVPYFINENNLETSDILVTALFRAAFDFNRYGFSAMFALVIFLILLAITIVYMRLVSFSPSTVASRKARETLTVGENA
jgi:arabinogalactan oligomer/maltooligosaccharide transport system permease protein